jgi:hypothetical protein
MPAKTSSALVRDPKAWMFVIEYSLRWLLQVLR